MIANKFGILLSLIWLETFAISVQRRHVAESDH